MSQTGYTVDSPPDPIRDTIAYAREHGVRKLLARFREQGTVATETDTVLSKEKFRHLVTDDTRVDCLRLSYALDGETDLGLEVAAFAHGTFYSITANERCIETLQRPDAVTMTVTDADSVFTCLEATERSVEAIQRDLDELGEAVSIDIQRPSTIKYRDLEL